MRGTCQCGKAADVTVTSRDGEALSFCLLCAKKLCRALEQRALAGAIADFERNEREPYVCRLCGSRTVRFPGLQCLQCGARHHVDPVKP